MEREALLSRLIGEPLDVNETKRTFGGGFEDEQTPYGAMMGDDTLLTYKHVAERAGVSVSSVKRAIYSGDLSKPIEVGERAVRFRLADVRGWIRNSMR